MDNIDDWTEWERIQPLIKKLNLLDLGSLLMILSLFSTPIGKFVQSVTVHDTAFFLIAFLTILVGCSRKCLSIDLKSEVKSDDMFAISFLQFTKVKMDNRLQIEFVSTINNNIILKEQLENILTRFFKYILIVEYHSDQFKIDTDSRFSAEDIIKNGKSFKTINVDSQISKETFNCSTLVCLSNYDDKNKIRFFLKLEPRKKSYLLKILRYLLSTTFFHVRKKELTIVCD
jgi:hypothetical protein